MNSFEIQLTGPRSSGKPQRECGDCQLCCRLLPMVDNEPWRDGAALNKPANVRCPHQKFGKGCGIYAKRPYCCQVWNCRWLVNDDAAELSRPDRSHVVIDVMPDFVTAVDNETGATHQVQVVQIWCDPKYPDAHRDPALRRWIHRKAEQGIATLVRFNEKDAITIIAPPMNSGGTWVEVGGNSTGKNHTADEVIDALGGAARMVIEDRNIEGGGY